MRRRAGAGLTSALAAVTGALAVAVLVVVAPPAGAHQPEGTITVLDPDRAPLDEPSTGEELAVRGQFRHTNPDAPLVERVELSLSAPELPEGCPIPRLADVVGEEAAREFTRPLPVLDCNGAWSVLARATTGDATPLHGAEQGTDTARFAQAVPPIDPVGLDATADGGQEEPSSVTLTWLANPELDLIGYRVERAEPEADEYEVLGLVGPEAEPTFTDDDISVGGEHLYRVAAVRSGVTAEEEDLVASIGYDKAVVEVAAPPATTTTSGGTTSPSSPGPTSFSQLPGSARPGTRPGLARPPTTVDTGFGGTLPFDPSLTTTSVATAEPVGPPPPPAGDSAVVALTEEDGGGGDPRQLLLPVAGSLALLMGAAHLRHVVRKASEPDEVIAPL